MSLGAQASYRKTENIRTIQEEINILALEEDTGYHWWSKLYQNAVLNDLNILFSFEMNSQKRAVILLFDCLAWTIHSIFLFTNCATSVSSWTTTWTATQRKGSLLTLNGSWKRLAAQILLLTTQLSKRSWTFPISSCSQSVTAFLAEKRKQFAGTVAFKVTDILARNQNRHKIICLIGHYLNLLDKTFFHQVEYINNRSKLYPNLLLKNNNRILMVPNQLGLNKY